LRAPWRTIVTSSTQPRRTTDTIVSPFWKPRRAANEPARIA
jgi:hypothetical protein